MPGLNTFTLTNGNEACEFTSNPRLLVSYGVVSERLLVITGRTRQSVRSDETLQSYIVLFQRPIRLEIRGECRRLDRTHQSLKSPNL